MGNWRTVRIVGRIDPADAPAAARFVELGPDPANWGEFHPLCWPGPSLCGLGRWVPPRGGDIDEYGNLAERNYTVADVADTLQRMATIAPSLDIKVHCGGDWEDTACRSTITVHDGQVTIGPAEVERVTEDERMAARGELRMLDMLFAPSRTTPKEEDQ